MCVICIFEPGQMPPRDMLNNAVWNNWHSWGMVTLVDGKLDIYREVPESGEVNPDDVWTALLKDEEYTRILHLRHNTAGSTSIENCHPFDVFYGKVGGEERQVVFMHNGTMYEYKSKKQNSFGTMVDDPDGPSDTKNFVDLVLIPLMAGTDFGMGHGDITSPFVKKIISSLWPTGDNKGILIANDQKPYLIGTWRTIRPDPQDETTHFLASNDTYFDKVIRGPEQERREQREREEQLKAAAASSGSNGANVVYLPSAEKRVLSSLKDFNFGPPVQLNEGSTLNKVIDEVDFCYRDSAYKIGLCTWQEIVEFVEEGCKPENMRDFCQILDQVFTDYAYLYEEYELLKESFDRMKDEKETVEEKLSRATKHCAEMSNRLSFYEKDRRRVG